MYTDNVVALIGRDVEVTAGGMLYMGRLVEVTESQVFLQGEGGWIELAMETVTDMRERR